MGHIIYRSFLGHIFRSTKEFLIVKDKKKVCRFSSKIFSHSRKLQIVVLVLFLIQLSWFFDSLLLSPQSLIRNRRNWIWWPLAPVFQTWTVTVFFVLLIFFLFLFFTLKGFPYKFGVSCYWFYSRFS